MSSRPTPPLTILGMPGSPYSRKLRAVLRYRRIAHVWTVLGSPEARELPRARVALLPQLIVPGAGGTPEALIDSTPIIRRLEAMVPGRSVVPPDPAMAFLDALIEDYADEWVTKAMFHYRWAYAADVAHAAAILPRWSMADRPDAEAIAAGEQFSARQVGRLAVVGSNATTAPVIEESYERLLRLLDAQLTGRRFVFGGRPASADFALYGQLTQLAGFDPTPRAIALRVAPRVAAWVDLVEDLSGMEPADGAWLSASDAGLLRPLLAEVGRVYVPFLLANAAALAAGMSEVRCSVGGRPWVQAPFPYQAKCLAALRGAYAALPPGPRAEVDALLAGTGCEPLIAA